MLQIDTAAVSDADLTPPVLVIGQIPVYQAGDDTPKVSRVIAKARWGKDPNTIITGSADSVLRVWDVRSGEKVRKVRNFMHASFRGPPLVRSTAWIRDQVGEGWGEGVLVQLLLALQ